MSRVGFEPTIPVFEQAKTVHALDCAATVIVSGYNNNNNNSDSSELTNSLPTQLNPEDEHNIFLMKVGTRLRDHAVYAEDRKLNVPLLFYSVPRFVAVTRSRLEREFSLQLLQ
jgi:hypothetical protein